uniref:replication protein A 32 kDa subunit n=1 Tax=Urocitellus parryii TaxID=9999 RepID=UPI000E561424|nr:replication protein A 32 kDa subunit [Urocitellus parryii]
MWNSGFESYSSSTTFGGASSYTQSPGGFGSPTPSQAEKKSRARAQHIVPCTISQLLSATLVDEMFKIGNVEISQTDDTSGENTVVPPETYVKVAGHLRSFQNKKSLVAFKIMPLEDMNEFTTHILEVVNAHMVLSKSNSQVLNLIKACPRPEGLNFQDLRTQLQHMPVASIK